MGLSVPWDVGSHPLLIGAIPPLHCPPRPCTFSAGHVVWWSRLGGTWASSHVTLGR